MDFKWNSPIKVHYGICANGLFFQTDLKMSSSSLFILVTKGGPSYVNEVYNWTNEAPALIFS